VSLGSLSTDTAARWLSVRRDQRLDDRRTDTATPASRWRIRRCDIRQQRNSRSRSKGGDRYDERGGADDDGSDGVQRQREPGKPATDTGGTLAFGSGVTSVSTTGVQSYGDASVTLAHTGGTTFASSGNQSITFQVHDRDDERAVQTTTV